MGSRVDLCVGWEGVKGRGHCGRCQPQDGKGEADERRPKTMYPDRGGGKRR